MYLIVLSPAPAILAWVHPVRTSIQTKKLRLKRCSCFQDHNSGSSLFRLPHKFLTKSNLSVLWLFLFSYRFRSQLYLVHNGTCRVPVRCLPDSIWYNIDVYNVFPANYVKELLGYSHNPTELTHGSWAGGKYPKGYWAKQLFCTKQIQYLFYSRFTHRKVLFYLLCPKQTKITKLRIMFQFCVIFTLPLAEFKLGAVSLGKCDLSLYWIFLGLGIFSFKLSGKTKIASGSTAGPPVHMPFPSNWHDCRKGFNNLNNNTPPTVIRSGEKHENWRAY